MSSVFPALCTQHAQLTQYWLQHCLSSTPTSSELLAPHRGKYTMNPQTQPRLLCNWNPLWQNKPATSPFLSTEAKGKGKKGIFHYHTNNERKVRKGSKASEVPSSWSLVQLIFLPSSTFVSAVWRLVWVFAPAGDKRGTLEERLHKAEKPPSLCSTLSAAQVWASACATAQPHVRKGSHCGFYLRMLLWNLIPHSQGIRKQLHCQWKHTASITVHFTVPQSFHSLQKR